MKSFSLIKPFFYQRRWIIAAGLAALIVVDILQLMVPRIIKWAIDDITTRQADQHQLLRYGMAIVMLALVIGVFRYIWRRCLLGTSRLVEEGLRNRLLDHLQTLPAEYFDHTPTGELMAHATNDIKQIRMATGMGLVAFNDAIVLGIAAIGFMAYINVHLTLMVLIPMPLIAIGTRFFSRKMHRRYLGVQSAFATLTETIRERIAGIRIIKAYNQLQEQERQVNVVSTDYVKQNLKLVRILGVFHPLMLLLTSLSLAIVLFWGGRQTIDGIITPGDLIAFISYLGLMTWPMMAMGWVTNLIQRGRASLDRLNEVLNITPSIASPPVPLSLRKSRGRIQFEKVYFSYNSDSVGEKSTNALRNLSLDIETGETLGIVGPPGSGKTTLLNLIPRLYDPQGGRILIDGQELAHFALPDLRAQIAIVPQEPFLFAGSLRDNITLQDGHYDETTVLEACRKAALQGTIDALTDGLDTLVGEKGIMLSGGQKQRVALARALLSNAPILLLDDPVSQVDTETADTIIRHLTNRLQERTSIIVSHRLSALRFADRIAIMEAGQITAIGQHTRLIATDNYYAHAHLLQQTEETIHGH